MAHISELVREIRELKATCASKKSLVDAHDQKVFPIYRHIHELHSQNLKANQEIKLYKAFKSDHIFDHQEVFERGPKAFEISMIFKHFLEFRIKRKNVEVQLAHYRSGVELGKFYKSLGETLCNSIFAWLQVDKRFVSESSWDLRQAFLMISENQEYHEYAAGELTKFRSVVFLNRIHQAFTGSLNASAIDIYSSLEAYAASMLACVQENSLEEYAYHEFIFHQDEDLGLDGFITDRHQRVHAHVIDGAAQLFETRYMTALGKETRVLEFQKAASILTFYEGIIVSPKWSDCLSRLKQLTRTEFKNAFLAHEFK